MIIKVTYNWFYCTDKEYGDECYSYEAGKKGVVSIHEHLPRGEGDIHYCRVDFEDGHQERVLNINTVTSDHDGI
jgi:hypothetical protein